MDGAKLTLKAHAEWNNGARSRYFKPTVGGIMVGLRWRVRRKPAKGYEDGTYGGDYIPATGASEACIVTVFLTPAFRRTKTTRRAI